MLKTRLSMAVALVAGTLALSSCDSGDTIVSVNYSFDDATAMDVHMNVAKLHITVKAAAGNPVETDLDLMRDPDAGTITTATYKRITVNGLSGTATVTVVAKDSSGTEFKDSDGMTLMAVTPADSVVVEEHKVTAAFVTFKRVVKMPGGAGGAGGAGTGGTNGSGGTDASGGTTGSGGSGSGGSGSGGA